MISFDMGSDDLDSLSLADENRSEWLEFVRQQAERAMLSMGDVLQDELSNGHVGPRHRPDRRDLSVILRRDREIEATRLRFASIGRPASGYRR